ncbi:MAG TPA: hypothetical protein VK836_08405, partial [Streptosporangiaceae bacterium]|nr:hypothetical protein [Streptosporangiaceae bacterium]
MDAIAVLAGLVATAVTDYLPAGVDPLDFVGAGVDVGAGAGAVVGGASVGAGLGGADAGVVLAGCEFCARLAAGDELAAVGLGDDAPADGDAAGLLELGAGPGGDGLAPGMPVEDGVPDVVPAALCAAVLAKRVAIPNAATTLSSVARHVSLDRRRSPASRRTLRFRCFTDLTPPGLRLRAHQGRPSDSLLPGPGFSSWRLPTQAAARRSRRPPAAASPR